EVEMNAKSQLVVDLPAESAADPARVESAELGARARAVWLIGPLTVVAGIVWAILQPYRITLLHPHGQGFWFLLVEPPIWVVAAGTLFRLCVARPLVAAPEEAGEDE